VRREIGAALAAGDWSGAAVIGSGGTFTNLGSMEQARRGAAGRSVHGISVGKDELRILMLRLADMSAEERRKVPGLKPERADIIVAGLAVALQLLEVVRANAVTVSGYGIRDGVLLEMTGLH
jgi:exopolyphosphatase/guanosine-5'-triphosphate,3'-diphosphate pyrophosphatase